MDTIPTSRVHLNVTLSSIPTKGRLLNERDCYMWVYNRSKLIGWTYNYNPLCVLWKRFDRLISCQGKPSSRVRLANNTHMKCYLSKKSMLITSFNLTNGTINDMGIEVEDIVLRNYMRRMFNKHWKELE